MRLSRPLTRQSLSFTRFSLISLYFPPRPFEKFHPWDFRIAKQKMRCLLCSIGQSLKVSLTNVLTSCEGDTPNWSKCRSITDWEARMVSRGQKRPTFLRFLPTIANRIRANENNPRRHCACRCLCAPQIGHFRTPGALRRSSFRRWGARKSPGSLRRPESVENYLAMRFAMPESL